MSLELSNTDKLGEFRREAKRLGIKVEPPDVNRSGVTFDVRQGAILYALAAVKGVGVEAARAIVTARGDKPFASPADFARRIEPRQLNKRTLERLVGAGALDCLEPNRARILAGLDAIIAESNAHHAEMASGQVALFGGNEGGTPLLLPDVEPMPLTTRMRIEYEAVGFYLSGHPLDQFAPLLEKAGIQDVLKFQQAVRGGASHARIAATLLDLDIKRTKTGSKIAILSLSDRSGQIEAMLFSELLAKHRESLVVGEPLFLTMAGNVDGEEVRLRILDLEPLTNALARNQRGIRVFVSEQALSGRGRSETPLTNLQNTLKRGGDGEVTIQLVLSDGREIEFLLPGRYDVSGAQLAMLSSLGGVMDVKPY